MFTTTMLAAMLAMTAQPASHPSKPAGGSTGHTQTVPRPVPASSSPQQRQPAPGNAAPAPAANGRGGGAGQGQIDHSAAARSNWDHRRAYYWQEYKRPYGRGGYGNAVSSGVKVTPGLPSPPSSVEATHNLDATVTVTWVMPGGVIPEGDVFEVGRRQPGQQDFWKIGETSDPRFVDRQLQTLTSGTQYAVAVRRGNIWSPMSAVASSSPDHPLASQRGRSAGPGIDAPRQAAPVLQTSSSTDAPLPATPK